MDILATIKTLEALADVPDEQLAWFIENAELQRFAVGDFMFTPGAVIDEVQIILEGKLRIYSVQNGTEREWLTYQALSILGQLPYSRMKAAVSYGQVREPITLLALHKSKFRTMICDQHELTQAFVSVMTSRTRDFTALQQQSEKLMALGKLSAGLAHELNNPAAAIVRSSQELKKHLSLLPVNFKAVMSIRMEEKHIDCINNTLFQRLQEYHTNPSQPLSLLEKTSRENDIADWMDDHDIVDGVDMAENYVEFDFTMEHLKDIFEATGAANAQAVLKWIDDNLTTERMVTDIQDASKRIGDLVQSVKSYTYMDKAQGKQTVNVHEGIKNTVTMLHHKFKKFNVKFVESFDPKTPALEGFPGELNQVWTNLIDNALDALEDQKQSGTGIVEVQTKNDGEFLCVNVIDNGGGIPQDVQNNIFDPFFTTKDIGKGTGMGLDVVRKIVLHHNADIRVSSKPGRTEFALRFLVKG